MLSYKNNKITVEGLFIRLKIYHLYRIIRDCNQAYYKTSKSPKLNTEIAISKRQGDSNLIDKGTIDEQRLDKESLTIATIVFKFTDPDFGNTPITGVNLIIAKACYI